MQPAQDTPGASPGHADPLADLSALPVVQVDACAADHLELLLDGSYPTGPRYLPAADRAHVTERGTLPDGTPWPLPLALRAPQQAEPGGRVLLRDPESVPMAVLTVQECAPDGRTWLLAGPLTAVRPRSDRPFARLRAQPGPGTPGGSPRLVVPTDRLLHRHDLAAVAELADRHDLTVVILALTGAGRPDGAPLVRGLLAAAGDAGPGGAQVRVVPVPELTGLDPESTGTVLVAVAAHYGAARVLLPSGVGSAPAAGEVGLAADVGPPGPLGAATLGALLDEGAPLPDGFTTPAVEHELRRMHPPLHRRGLVVLFTGLSGSGKSTVAAAVADRLLESSERSLTVLDGDVVRTHLSAGLTFSRSDRDTNVRRIGWVAAEIARHGGTVLSAPIAPYARTREQVRSMVREAGAAFVLVHVATPLAVCEARDRKGLYAQARAGLIPEFTGISDPYEPPTDADLVLDTATESAADCAGRVLDLLRSRGLVRS